MQGVSPVAHDSPQVWKVCTAALPYAPFPRLFHRDGPVGLTSPLIGAVTNVEPGSNWRFRRILKELWLTGVIAAIIAVLCGLPFQLLAYLLSTPPARAGIRSVVHSPGAGWYVVCVAVVLRAIALIPALRYKDKPFVTEPTLGVSPLPAPSSPPPAPKSETGGVLTH